MADYSLADIMAIKDGDDGVFGGNAFLWVILIFLFFLGFSGNGFLGNGGGNSGMAQVERDVLTTSCATQREVLDSRFTTQLGFQTAQAQMAQCCCDLRSELLTQIQSVKDMMNETTIQSLRDNLQGANQTLANQVLANSIINQLQPVSKPAYLTCSPYASFCGCGSLV